MLRSGELVLTNHARQRLAEYSLKEAFVTAWWPRAVEIEISYRHQLHKWFRYSGQRQRWIRYFETCGYVFTVEMKPGTPPVLITVASRSRFYKGRFPKKLHKA
jgi:hypothetical protein